VTQTTILFTCPDNAVLGPMAEACMNAAGDGRIRAFSAGRDPAQKLHSGVDRLLRREGFRMDLFSPKSWDIFAQPHAPRVDMIIALSEDVVGGDEPRWVGEPRRGLWRFSALEDAGRCATNRLDVAALYKRILIAVEGFATCSESSEARTYLPAA
jgi:arsenate reductase (thioredoxin)